MGQGIFANGDLGLSLSLLSQLTQTNCGGCEGFDAIFLFDHIFLRKWDTHFSFLLLIQSDLHRRKWELLGYLQNIVLNSSFCWLV